MIGLFAMPLCTLRLFVGMVVDGDSDEMGEVRV